MGAANYQSLVVRWLDSIPLPVEHRPRQLQRRRSRAVDELRDVGRRGPAQRRHARGRRPSVERWRDAGADQLIFGVLNNTLPLEVAQESIETFGREVIPAFDPDPVHSTTRQRDAQVGAA